MIEMRKRRFYGVFLFFYKKNFRGIEPPKVARNVNFFQKSIDKNVM
jgi:hypothetical protein